MNFVLDYQMIYLAAGLLGLILINILLGSISSFLERKFDLEIFVNGLIKGIIVIVSFAGVYLIGFFVPDILIEINGQEFTLLMAVNIIVFGGFVFYAKEVLVKLSAFVNAKFL